MSLLISAGKKRHAGHESRGQATEPVADALKGKHVLVVDDVADNRILVERYLVLMDIQMHGMEGCEATEKLRAHGLQSRSAHALGNELDRCLLAGCDMALTKPITKRSLVDKLSQILTVPK
jgi:CheY-like chemotaxis protein